MKGTGLQYRHIQNYHTVLMVKKQGCGRQQGLFNIEQIDMALQEEQSNRDQANLSQVVPLQ